MTKIEIKDNIKKLEDLRDSLSDDSSKKIIQDQIECLKSQLKKLEDEEKTTGQKIGSSLGRIGGSMVGIFMGVVDDCLNGNTNSRTTKRTRAKYADSGETVGNAIGGVSEKIIKKL